jgi:hypothetical protein
MGVLEAVAEAGPSVPGALSVAGYDHTTFAAFDPISLTSVDQAGQEMGRNAVRLLLERIEDRGRPSSRVTLPQPSYRAGRRPGSLGERQRRPPPGRPTVRVNSGTAMRSVTRTSKVTSGRFRLRSGRDRLGSAGASGVS